MELKLFVVVRFLRTYILPLLSAALGKVIVRLLFPLRIIVKSLAVSVQSNKTI